MTVGVHKLSVINGTEGVHCENKKKKETDPGNSVTHKCVVVLSVESTLHYISFSNTICNYFRIHRDSICRELVVTLKS